MGFAISVCRFKTKEREIIKIAPKSLAYFRTRALIPVKARVFDSRSTAFIISSALLTVDSDCKVFSSFS